jgi:hypothetical protein
MVPVVIDEIAREVDQYILDHPDCKLNGQTKAFEIDGRRRELEIFRLPLSILRYNIRNGRFASELLEREQEVGHQLDPNERDDAREIEKLLLKNEDAAKFLSDTLKRVGQLDPGIITHDGSIIDGNRRAAVLNQLFREEQDDEYSFFFGVRLPPNISDGDLWRIEAGIQLSYDYQAPYGPINELIKIRDGTKFGFRPTAIARTLGGDNTSKKIEFKLAVLETIEDYLAYCNIPRKYSEAERKVEHFIDVQNIKNTKTYKALTPEQKEAFLHSAYLMIRAGVAHLRIRDLRKVIADPDELAIHSAEIFRKWGLKPPQVTGSTDFGTKVDTEIEELSDVLSEEMPAKSVTIPSTEPEEIASQQEEEEEEESFGPDATQSEKVIEKRMKGSMEDVLSETLDRIGVKGKKKMPNKLVERTRTSLEALDAYSNEDLEVVKDEIIEIANLSSNLANRLGR